MLNLRVIYDYWSSKIIQGKYSGLSLLLNEYEDTLSVYIKTSDPEIPHYYLGRLNSYGLFNGSNVELAALTLAKCVIVNNGHNADFTKDNTDAINLDDLIDVILNEILADISNELDSLGEIFAEICTIIREDSKDTYVLNTILNWRRESEQ